MMSAFHIVEKALTLDGCFNTVISSCEFDECNYPIVLRSGKIHNGGYIEINNSVFRDFSFAIHDYCVASDEKDQGVVEIDNCKFYESNDSCKHVVNKNNSDNVWLNKKHMLYDYQFKFSNCYFDKRLFPFDSMYYGDSEIPNLIIEIYNLGNLLDR